MSNAPPVRPSARRTPPPMAAQLNPPPIAVHFVLLTDSLLLDWAGPAEALRMANQVLQARGLPAAFSLHFVGPATGARTSVGVRVTGLAPLPDLAPTPDRPQQWVVLVGQPGRAIVLDSPEARTVLHWLRGLRLETARLELLCVCAGSVIAARAGLLAGHRVTTHHQHLDEPIFLSYPVAACAGAGVLGTKARILSAM